MDKFNVPIRVVVWRCLHTSEHCDEPTNALIYNINNQTIRAAAVVKMIKNILQTEKIPSMEYLDFIILAGIDADTHFAIETFINTKEEMSCKFIGEMGIIKCTPSRFYDYNTTFKGCWHEQPDMDAALPSNCCSCFSSLFSFRRKQRKVSRSRDQYSLGVAAIPKYQCLDIQLYSCMQDIQIWTIELAPKTAKSQLTSFMNKIDKEQNANKSILVIIHMPGKFIDLKKHCINNWYTFPIYEKTRYDKWEKKVYPSYAFLMRGDYMHWNMNTYNDSKLKHIELLPTRSFPSNSIPVTLIGKLLK